jgi:hypothetical protein
MIYTDCTEIEYSQSFVLDRVMNIREYIYIYREREREREKEREREREV